MKAAVNASSGGQSSTGCSNADSIANSLNCCYNDLVWQHEISSEERPLVCTVCDCFVRPSDMDSLSLDKFANLKGVLITPETKKLPQHLKDCYRFQCCPSEFQSLVSDVLLSPRGRYILPISPNGAKRRKKNCGTGSMSICRKCKHSLNKHEMPKFAIANGYFFGSPPQCLLDLTDVERAWITPVRTFGIVYVYTGGPMQQLQGTASFYKRESHSIASATKQLEILGLTKDGVSVVLLGSMTDEQIKKAKSKAKIRPKEILAAVRWLVRHNVEWQNINMNEIESALRKKEPIIVRDDSHLAEEVNANVEKTERFRVYFPDGKLQNSLGGQQTCTDFLQAALNDKASTEDPTTSGSKRVFLNAKFEQERVHDYKDKNLVNACLLQFPFGRGGLTSERRYDGGAERTGKDPLHEEYIEHLSNISQPHFHQQLFTLVLFNYLMKDWMVRKAAVACKNEGTAKMLAENLTSSDLLEALEQKKTKKPVTSPSARKMLSTLEAVASSAPHTNEAARKAQYKIDTLQCHFGLPSWFLTVTPDDENSVLLQIYSGIDIDLNITTWEQVERMSDEELAGRAIKKRKLRYSYPGIAAWNFENQRDAIIKHVIGWDTRLNCPTSTPGLFGDCQAFAVSVEEQGRKSLHMHMLIWIMNTRNAFAAMFQQNKKHKREAREFLCSEIDRVSSCELIGKISYQTPGKRRRIFKHCNCETFNGLRKPQQPALISAQRLRDLRNSKGIKKITDHMQCLYCDTTFGSNEIIGNYLKELGMEQLSSFPENKSKRVKGMAMALINGGGKDTRTIPIFNAAYNHHIHTRSSCFCKGNGSCSSIDCRYKYPKLPHTQTTLIQTENTMNWYDFDGSYQPRSIFETAPKRNVTDAFMNQYCLAVGATKLINGNTNISLLMPGAVARYTSKYAAKGTQKDDSAEYSRFSERVLKAVHRLDIENLERKEKERTGVISEDERKSVNETSALTKVLRLGFTRHEPNVVGAPLASYLIRNKTRFVMSHDFQWVPIWDIETVITGGGVKRYYQNGRSGSYWSNSAYDYLCRPMECTNYSLFEFMESFEVVRQKPTTSNELLKFVSVNGYVHPSWKDGKTVGSGSFRAGVRFKSDAEGSKKKLLQIPSYFLPDTATFNGSIKDVLSVETELYCRRALMLVKPFRVLGDLRMMGPDTKQQILILESKTPKEGSEEFNFLNDLKSNGSFTETFRHWLADGVWSEAKKKAIAFLQQYQECTYNCTRKSRVGDELDRLTTKYRSSKERAADGNDDDNESTGSQEDTNGENYFFNEEELAEMVALLCPEHFLETSETKRLPKLYLTKDIRDKGRLRCGYDHIALMNPQGLNTDDESNDDERHPWLEISADSTTPNTAGKEDEVDNESDHEANDPSSAEIVEIIIERKERVLRTEKMFNKNAIVLEANGSRESILSWSKEAKLDADQQVAFETIVASFVLTFFNGGDKEDEANNIIGTNENTLLYKSEKAKLDRLADVENRESNQLIALLYGPGGSGKSYVIDLVLLYAQEYCSKFENFVFDKRTIVVTAMTGCAATLLNGETAHGAMKLNTKVKNLSDEDINVWKRTRLIIIDEISFASEETMDQINNRLKFLRELEETDPSWFGGIHVVFAGDFRQLDPVGSPPLYMTDYGLETKVNCFLELTGMHRFRKDPQWGQLLKKFRDGTVDKADIAKLNRYLMERNNNLPENLRYATYRNADRDAINMALFDRAIGSKSETEAQKFGLLVFADEIHLRTGRGHYSKRLGTCDLLYQHASESDIQTVGTSSQRMDPVLKLYEGIQVLLTKNEDVLNGIANGTQAEVIRVVLKSNEHYETIQVADADGGCRKVKAVFASQVEYVELKHVNDRVAVPIFRLEPQQFMFSTTLPSPIGDREIGMKATQLPITVNNATTGHKLQGSSVDRIFVHQWSSKRNWNYVVLSRVREMKGLFARKCLPNNLNIYKIPEQLKEMMNLLKSKVPSGKDFRHS